MSPATPALDPSFWNKVASLTEQAKETEADTGAIFEGIVTHFKDAGYDPFWTLGFLRRVAEDGGMTKISLELPTNMEGLKTQAGQLWNNAKQVGSGLVTEGKNLFQAGKDLAIKGKDLAVDKVGIPYEARYGTGAGTSFLRWANNGDAKATENSLRSFNSGNYADGAGQVVASLLKNPTVRQWGSYILPAVGTYAASKLMGADTGTAMLAGAAGGYAGGQAFEHGGFQNAWNANRDKYFPKAKPAVAPSAVAPEQTAAAATQQTTAHADQINQTAAAPR